MSCIIECSNIKVSMDKPDFGERSSHHVFDVELTLRSEYFEDHGVRDVEMASQRGQLRCGQWPQVLAVRHVRVTEDNHSPSVVLASPTSSARHLNELAGFQKSAINDHHNIHSIFHLILVRTITTCNYTELLFSLVKKPTLVVTLFLNITTNCLLFFRGTLLVSHAIIVYNKHGQVLTNTKRSPFVFFSVLWDKTFDGKSW